MQVTSRVVVVTAAVAAVAVIAGTASGGSSGAPTGAGKGAHVKAPAAAGSATVLFSNNTNDAGIGISSQNFESNFAAYDDAAADDFFVPANTKWHVTEVDAYGVYYNGPGPANSETVTFYTNSRHKVPGNVKGTPFTLQGVDSAGTFAITLPGTGVTFKGGTRGKTYWVSVVVNMPLHPNGQWAWETSTNAVGNTNVWENPSNGFNTGCTTWTAVATCFPGEGSSQMFALLGTHKP
jgi:hypothetical protein